MVLTLLTILYSTYITKLAILTYTEILTLLTVLHSTLYIYTKKTLLALLTYITDYIRYKNIHVNVHTKGNKKDH